MSLRYYTSRSVVRSAVWWLLLVCGECMSMMMMESFSHVIKCPHVPYELGVRRIHSPESLLLLKPPARMLTLFRMEESAPPQTVVGTYSCVSFGLRSKRQLSEPLHARMLTNTRHESHLVLLSNNETPIVMMKLSVKREGPSGHTLHMQGQLFTDDAATALWQQQLRIIRMGLVLESMAALFVVTPTRLVLGATAGKWQSCGMGEEDPNLRLYRKAVLAV